MGIRSFFAERSRVNTEKRAITSLPWLPWDVGGGPVAAVTQSRALALSPVYAAVRHISDNISTLPIDGFRRLEENKREKLGTLPQLFKILVDNGQLPPWLSSLVASLALRGNGVGLITALDGLGFPVQIEWVPMEKVFVDDSKPRPEWFLDGRRIDRSEIVHIPWVTLPGRTLGLSPIEAFALTVEAGLEAQVYGADWFRAGGIPPGTFKNDNMVVDEHEATVIKGRLVNAIRSHQPIVYGKDWTYQPITIPPEQAQFVETAKLTANQIAAIYGIAPEEVGGEAANSLTYSNEEHRQTTRMHNLRPWLVRMESAFFSWLPARQYIKFNVDAVIRSDLRTRHEVYKIDLETGIRDLNEIRTLEDLPPKEVIPTPAPTRIPEQSPEGVPRRLQALS